MDCSIFRKRILDLIEDNLSYDLKEAMLEHVKTCKQCSALYNEELEIDEMFKTTLSIDTQSFRSLRSDVMKNIDKNKYGASPVKKLSRHFRNNKAIYSTIAAAVIIFAVIVPNLRAKELFGSAKSSTMSIPQSASVGIESAGAAKNSLADTKSNKLAVDASAPLSKSDGINGTVKGSNEDIQYVPSFEKKELDKNTAVKFNTPWENSKGNKYSACVEGKGSEALEEGIGKIIIKEVSSGSMWSFSLINNDNKQFSPKAVKWIDDENLLVIVGLGYGHFSQGGDLYILNINSSRVIKADPANTIGLVNKEEITKILAVRPVNSGSISIDVEVRVFDDSIYNASHRENRSIVR